MQADQHDAVCYLLLRYTDRQNVQTGRLCFAVLYKYLAEASHPHFHSLPATFHRDSVAVMQHHDIKAC